MERVDFSQLVEESHFEGIELARGYFEDISCAADGLLVSGWALLPATEFDSVRILLDGELVGAAPIGVREDVAKAFPWIPHARQSGFLLQAPVGQTSRCRLDVLGFQDGRPAGRMSTLFRADVDAAVPTPPAALMERVAATRHASFFKIGGLKSFGEFLAPICRHRPLRSIRRMLDWGCGCGRVTAHFLLEPEGPEVCGCDIDPKAIAWCAAHLKPGHFTRSEPWPPTPYPDATFDLVIGYSVFTHLAREVQQAWLAEIRRIIVPGGLFLASTHGSFAAGFAYPKDSAEMLRHGIVDSMLDPSLDGIAPEGYYRGVFQTREYTVREWSKHFEILEYIERGMGNYQDLVVMRRPA